MIEYDGENKCKGMFYRCISNEFINSTGEYVNQVRFRPLKKISCKGCEICEQIKDEIKDGVLDNNDFIQYDTVEHGKIYKLDYSDIERDWETGIIDGWSLKFEVLIQKTKKVAAGGEND